jgi:hypothetical protein
VLQRTDAQLATTQAHEQTQLGLGHGGCVAVCDVLPDLLVFSVSVVSVLFAVITLEVELASQ